MKKHASSISGATVANVLQGHRGMTVAITAIVLLLAACVFFVNTVVITPGTDEAYRAEAEKKASLINFDTSALTKVQKFSADADDTNLPNGRINPFSQN
jgi:hypothetical protein